MTACGLTESWTFSCRRLRACATRIGNRVDWLWDLANIIALAWNFVWWYSMPHHQFSGELASEVSMRRYVQASVDGLVL